jgi:hypothetical protein
MEAMVHCVQFLPLVQRVVRMAYADWAARRQGECALALFYEQK